MKHFYRTTDQNNQAGLMVMLMHRQELFQPTGTEGMTEIKVPCRDLPQLTALALGVMELCNTPDLVSASVIRCAHGTTAQFGEKGTLSRKFFVLILHAGENALVTADDEAVYVKSREVWSISNIDAIQLLNKSEDDVFLLLVEVR